MVHPSTTTLSSPLGRLTAVTDGEALVGLYFEGHRPAPPRPGRWPVDGRRPPAAAGPLVRLAARLDEYFAGDRTTFDDVDVRLDGSPFQRRVWDVLRTIPYGTTITYGELARRLGRDPATAARAVGAANARNPVSIVVPCHRVVASTGALAGYAGGAWRKRFLLDLEATA